MIDAYLRVLDKLDDIEEILVRNRLLDRISQNYLDKMRFDYESKIMESGDYPRGV